MTAKLSACCKLRGGETCFASLLYPLLIHLDLMLLDLTQRINVFSLISKS